MADDALKKASVLAVGTELTTGQITNRNAAWISEKLVELGAEVVLHETVADDRAMIRAALERCLACSRLIFVTGGLGPTSDDFTREVVAEWLGKPLLYHEPSWSKIVERLTRFNIPVAESNRQQCYFPEGAHVLPNPEGTADAFMADHGEARVWVLPGPPREVAAVWDQGIAAQARERLPKVRKLRLLTWQCLGKSEAELGELTESALRGSGLQTGYRAHRPYVEIKVWCPEDDLAAHAGDFARLEKAIGSWIVTRQGEDLAALLLRQVSRSESVEAVDAATGGILTERLGSLLRQPEFAALAENFALATEWHAPGSPEEWVTRALQQSDPESLTLAIAGFTRDGSWAIGLREGETLRTEPLRAPWARPELMDRIRRYAVEIALKRWLEWLRQSTH